VYAIDDKESFEELTALNKRSSEGSWSFVGQGRLEETRHVKRVDGEKLAICLGSGFLELSAKARINVDQVFHEVRRIRRMRRSSSEKGVKLSCTVF
jgi:hypothetical protein